MSSEIKSTHTLFHNLNSTRDRLTKNSDSITSDRKIMLHQLTAFIQNKIGLNQKIYLNFICTHNSRRSHLAQLWAQVAAFYYSIPRVECFSGGIEATAFNSRAVKAMQDAGFHILKLCESDNPQYEVSFSNEAAPILSFSKKYDDMFNHNKDFAAIITCSHADENCPLVVGADARIAITYDDPKEFDNTNLETAKYKERGEQIGTEILYAFSLLKV